VLYTRRALPESPRFLVAAGRIEEASEAVSKAAHIAGDPNAVPSMESFTSTGTASPRSASLRSLWSGVLARRTLMLWILWFGMVFSYYGIFTWLPTILADTFKLVDAFQYNLVITLAQVPGYFTAAWLVERLGRRITLSAFLVGSAAGAFLFRNASSTWELIVYGSLISFFALGAWGVIYTYTPELYPTRIRGWGAGLAAAVGRIGGILGPYITARIVAEPGGVNIAFYTFTVIFLIIAANVFLLGEETRGRSLEEITSGTSEAVQLKAATSDG